MFDDFVNATKTERELILSKLDSIINILPGVHKETDIFKLKKNLNQSHYGHEELKETMILEAIARNTPNKTERKIYLLNGNYQKFSIIFSRDIENGVCNMIKYKKITKN